MITPDLKAPIAGKNGYILFVDLSNGKSRVSGTALAQVYNSLGNDVPDVESADMLKNAFKAIQRLIAGNLIINIVYKVCSVTREMTNV